MSTRSQRSVSTSLKAHAGVEPKPQGVPHYGVAGLGLDAGAPAGQHLGRGGDLAPQLAMELAAGGEPQIDRVAQTVEIDAGPAVDRAQQGHRLVGLRPAVICGDAIEAGLHVAAGYGVEGAGEPIAEMAVGLVAVEFVGRLRAVGIGGHVVLEGVAKGWHGTRLRALPRRIVAAGDLAEGRLCQASGLIGGDFSVAAQ